MVGSPWWVGVIASTPFKRGTVPYFGISRQKRRAKTASLEAQRKRIDI
jgi:hypothetical protein